MIAVDHKGIDRDFMRHAIHSVGMRNHANQFVVFIDGSTFLHWHMTTYIDFFSDFA
jgi:hypothetical protein